ncbi:MAG: carbohydrate porin [Verrucomicrobiota bacterium]
MKTPITPVLRTCAILGLLQLPVWATPLPQQSPFETPPQNPNAPPTATQPPATGTTTTAGPGMPELPTTSPSAGAPAMPEGLGASQLSMWKQDEMTGDWGGIRDDMLNHGVAISPTWIGEVFGNPSGGAGKGVISDGLINVALDLDLDRMSDSPVFDDVLVHANAMYIYGSSLSGSFVGDFSNTSNIASYNTVRLQELWLQKQFWEKRISVKVGNIAWTRSSSSPAARRCSSTAPSGRSRSSPITCPTRRSIRWPRPACASSSCPRRGSTSWPASSAWTTAATRR